MHSACRCASQGTGGSTGRGLAASVFLHLYREVGFERCLCSDGNLPQGGLEEFIFPQ